MFAAAVCVVTHCRALRQITNLLGKMKLAAQARMTILFLLLLSVHIFEIWIFGFCYYLSEVAMGGDAMTGPRTEGFLEYIYFSAVTYTTIGYGDLLPLGPVRFVAAVEALSGLLMIGWSASLTYLEMQRFWKIS